MDPRWLEVLKASGWQLFAISIALTGFWLLLQFEFLPKIDLPLIVYGLPLAILVTFALALVSAAEALAKRIQSWNQKRVLEANKEKKAEEQRQIFRDYVPFLVEKEWEILAYLYQNKEKTFVASVDGDLASTLYNRGFIKMLARPGQQVSVMSCTFSIPDPVREVMQEMDERFSEPIVELGYRNKRPWHSGF
ncbi:hypothetical protein [Roseovarius aestuarii]|uniref:Superinfection exclusion protein B n=1 Tax=Roseovarius aestuarii TaxID=475083 RepID=A0A1X7BXB7_9RHOB|nr:hypothetical protein [Roseovarius aestuarii]SMC14287.1 hypothetical protein ROA7745_04153 [Roseovarius aestuarii]